MGKLVLTILAGMLFGAVTGAVLAGVNEYLGAGPQPDWSEIDIDVLLAAFAGASFGGGVGGFTGLLIAAFRYKKRNAKFR